MSKEYICRESLKAEFTGNFQDEYSPNLIKAIIDSQPAADVAEVKCGLWEFNKEDIKWGNYLKRKQCSVCGCEAFFDKKEYKFITTNYCPHCGAKMDGGEANE